MIRKILMRFAAEGLAARLPGHGWRFADSLADDGAYRESYEFRLIVECAAIAAPGFRVEPERAAAIRRAHNRVLENPSAVSGGDEWFRVNAEFHEGLAGFSNNRFLAEAVRQQTNLRRMQESAAFSELPVARIVQSSHEHLAILDAAEAGDRDWAEALLRATSATPTSSVGLTWRAPPRHRRRGSGQNFGLVISQAFAFWIAPRESPACAAYSRSLIPAWLAGK